MFFNQQYWARAMASVAVCGVGAFSMYASGGATGVGWAVLGLLIIWS